MYKYIYIYKGNEDYNIQFQYAGTYNENRPRFTTYSKLDYGPNMNLGSRMKFSK